MRKCPICKKDTGKTEIKIFGVCINCLLDIETKAKLFRTNVINGLHIRYNTIFMEQPPMVDCNCENKKYLIYDFFTRQYEDKTYICLNAVCTICGGYKEIFTKDEIEFNIIPVNGSQRYNGEVTVRKKDYHMDVA